MNKLFTIEENELSSEDNNLYIEITFLSDYLPTIKSYYIMNSEEYKNLKILYMDIYIENFINNETLTKNKLDIHIINNKNNINIIKDFIKLFGNSFDILKHIYSKKNEFNQINDLQNFLSSNSESESDDIISSITEIINTYNKTNVINNEIIIKKSIEHPEILDDDVIKEFYIK